MSHSQFADKFSRRQLGRKTLLVRTKLHMKEDPDGSFVFEWRIKKDNIVDIARLTTDNKVHILCPEPYIGMQTVHRHIEWIVGYGWKLPWGAFSVCNRKSSTRLHRTRARFDYLSRRVWAYDVPFTQELAIDINGAKPRPVAHAPDMVMSTDRKAARPVYEHTRKVLKAIVVMHRIGAFDGLKFYSGISKAVDSMDARLEEDAVGEQAEKAYHSAWATTYTGPSGKHVNGRWVSLTPEEIGRQKLSRVLRKARALLHEKLAIANGFRTAKAKDEPELPD